MVFSLTFIVWSQVSYHFDECYLPYKSILSIDEMNERITGRRADELL